jgi:hypothetical protein
MSVLSSCTAAEKRAVSNDLQPEQTLNAHELQLQELQDRRDYWGKKSYHKMQNVPVMKKVL